MLQISYGCFESGVCGQNFGPEFPIDPRTAISQRQTMDYKIQLRTSQTDYVSTTNLKIYQFVAICGSSGHSVIPP